MGTPLYPQGAGRGCKGINPQQRTLCLRGTMNAWAAKSLPTQTYAGYAPLRHTRVNPVFHHETGVVLEIRLVVGNEGGVDT